MVEINALLPQYGVILSAIKKVLTSLPQFDIITPALNESASFQRPANLENDTEKREKELELRCDEPGDRGASRGEEQSDSKS